MNTISNNGEPSAANVTRPRGAQPIGVRPHGGTLVDRLVTDGEAQEVLARAARLTPIPLDARTSADAELIATGAFSPLRGFVGHDDYASIITNMRLANGAVFSIPITLTAPRERARSLRVGEEASLVEASGEPVGTIAVEDVFELEPEREAREVYKTTDASHPGVAYLQSRGDALGIGGAITLARRTIERRFPLHHRDPSELRALLTARGWRRTVAFQTRNPIHRAHEYLLRSALEIADGLVVHPLVGETKGDDVPADVRMRCYETLLSKYFPADRALLSVFPFAMRYAGPREAVLHAVARQNYGFSHFIVGRDHAGVGKFYGTYDAQKIFDEIAPGELEITPLFFEHSFWCNACGQVASLKTCPHPESSHLILSGTRVRELLSKGELPPVEFSRPEVAEILGAAYRAAAS